jgi:hypothetical protein
VPDPETTLDPRYSEPDVAATSWDDARPAVESAEVWWLSTVRPDGRPHVTPLLAVWLDGALWFCTGAEERKARNLAANPQCVLTTGCNRMGDGLDVVVEGAAERCRDEAELRRRAAAYETKYGSDWHYDVVDGAFAGPAGVAEVYRVRPVTAFGFTRGTYRQTRWRFAPDPAQLRTVPKPG